MKRKDIFILNPMAGRHDLTEELTRTIEREAGRRGLDYRIERTGYPGHAEELAARLSREYAPRICRFYACGGDGTLNEVVNGAAEQENAELAVYPCGTGNDFVKLFDDPEKLLDLGALMDAPARDFDLMCLNDRYSINICGTGVDARVADWVTRNKHRVPFGGKLVYDLSLVVNFFGRLNRYFEVEIDGERLDGEYAILLAANGRYYGGGYFPVPEAEPDDGMLDFLLIRKVSHLTVLKLIGKFQRGLHGELGDYQVYRRGRRMTLRAKDEEPMNCDGEIRYTCEAVIALSPRRLPVAVPEGCMLIRGTEEKQPAGAKT